MWQNIISTVLGGGLLGIVVWAVNLQSRLAVLEADKSSLKDLMDAKLEDIRGRLQRIESKLDREQIIGVN